MPQRRNRSLPRSACTFVGELFVMSMPPFAETAENTDWVTVSPASKPRLRVDEDPAETTR